jgi:hypothetical protein
MPLPLHYLFVAGLGRRVIGPHDTVRNALVETLKAVAAAAPDAQPVAMASGASGADQAFLEAALSLGWPIRLVLPVAAYLFEQDFTSRDAAGNTMIDNDGLDRFRRLRAAAIEVEVISPSPDRHMAFTRCANTLVTEADVVVTLWDGKPGKQGGTNESLLLADHINVPLIILDAQTGLPYIGIPVPSADKLSRRHCERHAPGTILHDVDTLLASVPTTSGTLDERLKAAAKTLADSYKFKNASAILVHALAAALGLFALVFFHENHDVGYGATVIKLTAVLVAVWLVYSAKEKGEHHRWAKTRYIRETIRSLKASLPLAGHCQHPLARFAPTSLWVLARYLQRPLLLHVLTEPAQKDEGLLASLQTYRTKQLRLQNGYQIKEGVKAGKRHHWIERGFWGATILFFVAGFSIFMNHDYDGNLYKWAKWLTVFLPVFSAALLVLPNLWETHRRRRVAPAVARTYERLDVEAGVVEQVLLDLAAGHTPTCPDGTAVWAGSSADISVAIEAWAKTRLAAIVREAEHAYLTEVIGFKTFVENAEVG